MSVGTDNGGYGRAASLANSFGSRRNSGIRVLRGARFPARRGRAAGARSAIVGRAVMGTAAAERAPRPSGRADELTLEDGHHDRLAGRTASRTGRPPGPARAAQPARDRARAAVPVAAERDVRGVAAAD